MFLKMGLKPNLTLRASYKTCEFVCLDLCLVILPKDMAWPSAIASTAIFSKSPWFKINHWYKLIKFCFFYHAHCVHKISFILYHCIHTFSSGWGVVNVLAPFDGSWVCWKNAMRHFVSSRLNNLGLQLDFCKHHINSASILSTSDNLVTVTL